MTRSGFEGIFAPLPESPTGVWAVIDRDYHESITKVYPTEVEALRVLNGRGYGEVRFLPWGKDLADLRFEEVEGGLK